MVEPQKDKALTFRSWHLEIQNILIDKGVQGCGQKALLRAFKEAPKEEVIGFLDMLHKEDKVQKFKWANDTYWRATTEILKPV